jgi:hypothetical protein
MPRLLVFPFQWAESDKLGRRLPSFVDKNKRKVLSMGSQAWEEREKEGEIPV